MTSELIICTLSNGERIMGEVSTPQFLFDNIEDDIELLINDDTLTMNNPMTVSIGNNSQVFIQRYFTECKEIQITKSNIVTINHNIPHAVIEQYNIKLNYYEQVFDKLMVEALDEQNDQIRSIFSDKGKVDISMYEFNTNKPN